MSEKQLIGTVHGHASCDVGSWSFEWGGSLNLDGVEFPVKLEGLMDRVDGNYSGHFTFTHSDSDDPLGARLEGKGRWGHSMEGDVYDYESTGVFQGFSLGFFMLRQNAGDSDGPNFEFNFA